MKTLVEEKFLDYYEKWITKLEEYFHLLLQLSKQQHFTNNTDFEAMVSKLTAHHKEYYTSKWAAAHEDVLAFFSPVWLTPLENAHLWITGWKPSMAFRVLGSLRETRLAEMGESEWKKVEELRGKIRVEEEKVEREMERQQVMMADRRMVELARLSTGRVTSQGVDGMVEGAVDGLLKGLERVMKMGDCVRLKTLKGVLDLLNPKQSVEFLAAATTVEIQLRRWGKKRNTNTTTSHDKY